MQSFLWKRTGAEQMNSNSTEDYIELYNKSSIPVLIFDSGMKVVWLSDSCRRFFNSSINTGSSLSEITGINLEKEISRSPGGSCRLVFTHKSENMLSAEITLMIFPYRKKNDETELFVAYFDDLTNEKKLLLRKTYLGLLEASKLKDDDTGNHIKRVGAYARRLSEELYQRKLYPEVDLDFIENIHFVAQMHDVGKIGTPDDILTKRGPLTDSEWVIMKEHTINGALILSNYPDPMAGLIARSHHERWDGSGYPYGLSEDFIPLAARITAIADVYDALRMKRTYKEAFTHEKSCKIIQEESGSHFDPDLVYIFLSISVEFRSIYEALADENSELNKGAIEDLEVYVEDDELEELEEI